MDCSLHGGQQQRGNMEGAPKGPVLLKGPSPVFYHLPTMSFYDESIEGAGVPRRNKFGVIGLIAD